MSSQTAIVKKAAGRLRSLAPDALWRRMRRQARLSKAAAQANCILASFPKSGRTWLRYMITNYLNEAYALGQTIDLHSTFSLAPNFDLSPKRGLPALENNLTARGLPPVYVTHLAHDRRLFGEVPIVFLLRDPREVMVSAYFHAVRHKQNFDGDMTAFLDKGEYGLTSYILYHNVWAEALRAERDLVVTYADLSTDAEKTLERIAIHRDWRIETVAIEKAVALSSFERMRETETATGIPDHEYDRSDPNSLRMRRGQTGVYSDDLTGSQIEMINQRLSRELTTEARALVDRIGKF